MRENLSNSRRTQRRPLSEEELAKRRLKRAEAREPKMRGQLTDLAQGVGWSSDKILARYFGVSRQRIWLWSKEGKLPKPHKHGEATTRWLNSEVLDAERKYFLKEVR